MAAACCDFFLCPMETVGENPCDIVGGIGDLAEARDWIATRSLQCRVQRACSQPAAVALVRVPQMTGTVSGYRRVNTVHMSVPLLALEPNPSVAQKWIRASSPGFHASPKVARHLLAFSV